MLIIGFQGYGGRAINPAEEIVKALDGTTVAGTSVTGRTLPVRNAGHGERIRSLLEELRPPAIICLGLWPGEQMIRLERAGLNVSDFEIADNEGALEHGPVVAGGPLALAATLPIEAIRERLLAAGIPARLSSSAGNFLCNATLYHALSEQVAGIVLDTAEEARLELHQRGDLCSMALATQVEAIRLAAETTLESLQGTVAA